MFYHSIYYFAYLILSSVEALSPCSSGYIRCPISSPSSGICVPSVSWCDKLIYLNPFAPLNERIADLTDRLTLSQKVNMLQTTPVNNSAVPELLIEEITMGECLHGYVSRTPSTLFPQSTTLAASFNTNLVEKVAEAIGVEGRAWRNAWREAGNQSISPPSLTCFSPQINIQRSPLWGRGQETYGEDPFLTASIAKSYVYGLQGGESALNGGYLLAAATAKHFIAYQGATSRGTYSPTEVFVSWRDQIDTFEVAWNAVLSVNTQAVMCAYSSICHDDTNTTCSLPPPLGYGRSHGIPMCANDELLNGWLRAGPNGPRSIMVTGDCGAIQFVQTDHLWAPDQEHAAAASLLAGADFDCSISVGNGFAALINATENGLVKETDIDIALSRLLTIHFRLGLFDPVDFVPYNSIPMSVVNSQQHRGLAASAAREGIVLLLNKNNILPLSLGSGVLVVGPNAMLFATGNYNTITDHNVTAVEGISRYIPDATYIQGCDMASNDTSQFEQAIASAKKSRVVIAVMGLDLTQEYEDSTRSTLSLPGVQDQLLASLGATGTPVVLVIMGGSAVVPSASTAANMSAILWAGYGGEEAGTALADVLFGFYNPGGRLPFSFYNSINDLPPYLNMSMIGLPFGRTYRYYSGPPVMFRFGEGLSYSSFSLTGLNISPQSTLDICQSLSVKINVTNVGPLDGDTVIQVYVRLLGVPLLTPLQSLAGFQRLSAGVGDASQLVEFILSPKTFAVVNGTMKEWVLFPTTIGLFVGDQSPSKEEDWSGPTSATVMMVGNVTRFVECGS
jgi:beta-glucosidase